MNPVEKAVERVLASYQAAVLAADAEALMRLYHPDVRVFDTWGVWLYDGAPAWRGAIEGWFMSLGSEKVRVRFDEVRIHAEPPVATVSAIVTYAAESAAGEPLRSMQNRLSWVLRESGHVWRIVHEHTSAPVGFEDLKAMLTRTAGG